MPYGLRPVRRPRSGSGVSIPHMGCMPYGRILLLLAILLLASFNPSYGLHALRACQHAARRGPDHVSIPHMGCMPYGHMNHFTINLMVGFQSLIWVACPTGCLPLECSPPAQIVSIPHMGCMPYGQQIVKWGWGDAVKFQSLIWVACPTGLR